LNDLWYAKVPSGFCEIAPDAAMRKNACNSDCPALKSTAHIAQFCGTAFLIPERLRCNLPTGLEDEFDPRSIAVCNESRAADTRNEQ
jgi:hypothetical protein